MEEFDRLPPGPRGGWLKSTKSSQTPSLFPLTGSPLPVAEDLWNWESAGGHRRTFWPKDEEALSNKIARWLNDDLGPARGIVVNREVQPQRGSKTDVWVDAISKSDPTRGAARRLSIVIEVKGCWHGEVQNAIDSQLVGRYLKPKNLTHGIYIVGWFMCARWNNPDRFPKSCLNSTTFEEGWDEVRDLAAPYDGKQSPFTMRGVLLDCRYPN